MASCRGKAWFRWLTRQVKPRFPLIDDPGQTDWEYCQRAPEHCGPDFPILRVPRTWTALSGFFTPCGDPSS